MKKQFYIVKDENVKDVVVEDEVVESEVKSKPRRPVVLNLTLFDKVAIASIAITFWIIVTLLFMNLVFW